MNSMAEPTPAATPSKTKPKPTELGAPFEAPKYELPKFELPKMEIPAAFREVAEKSVSQAKETYEKMKSAAEHATEVMEDTYSTATKGASDYSLKMIEAARNNTNAAFDYYVELLCNHEVSLRATLLNSAGTAIATSLGPGATFQQTAIARFRAYCRCRRPAATIGVRPIIDTLWTKPDASRAPAAERKTWKPSLARF